MAFLPLVPARPVEQAAGVGGRLLRRVGRRDAGLEGARRPCATATLSRSSRAALCSWPRSLLLPLLLPAVWRRRVLWVAIPLVGRRRRRSSSSNGTSVQSPTEYARRALQSPPSTVFLFRAFEIDRIVSPDNGPASRELGQVVERELLTQEPYRSYGVDLDEFFSSGSDRMFADLTSLPGDRPRGRDRGGDSRHTLRTFIAGIGRTIWAQLWARRVFAPEGAAASDDGTGDAASPDFIVVNGRRLPAPGEGQPIPASRDRACDLDAGRAGPRGVAIADRAPTRVRRPARRAALRGVRARYRPARGSHSHSRREPGARAPSQSGFEPVSAACLLARRRPYRSGCATARTVCRGTRPCCCRSRRHRRDVARRLGRARVLRSCHPGLPVARGGRARRCRPTRAAKTSQAPVVAQGELRSPSRPPQPKRTNAGTTGSTKCASAGCPSALSAITSSAARRERDERPRSRRAADGDRDEPEQDPEHRPREPARELVQPVRERGVPVPVGQARISSRTRRSTLLEPRLVRRIRRTRIGSRSATPTPGGCRCPVARSRRPGPPGSAGPPWRGSRRPSTTIVSGCRPPPAADAGAERRGRTARSAAARSCRGTALAYAPGCSLDRLDAGVAEDRVVRVPAEDLVGEEVEVLVDPEAARREDLVARHSVRAVRLPRQQSSSTAVASFREAGPFSGETILSMMNAR